MSAETITGELRLALDEDREVVLTTDEEVLRGVIVCVDDREVTIAPAGISPERVDLRRVVRVRLLGTASSTTRTALGRLRGARR